MGHGLRVMLAFMVLLSGGLCLMPTASALTVPSWAGNFINFTFQNTQSANTVVNSIIQITIDAGSFESYSQHNLANWGFFDPVTGHPVDAWVEGCSSNYYAAANLFSCNSLKVDINYPFTIAASNTAVNTIALGLGSLSTNVVYYAANHIGYAPQLFCSGDNVNCPRSGYPASNTPVAGGAGNQAMDNGFNVWQQYTNGNWLNGFTTSGSGCTSNFDTGGLYAGTYNAPAAAYSCQSPHSIAPDGANVIITLARVNPAGAGVANGGMGLLPSSCSFADPAAGFGYDGFGTSTVNKYPNTQTGNIALAANTPHVFSMWQASNGMIFFYYDYANANAIAGAGVTQSLGICAQSGGSANLHWSWMAVGITPPNNVQPTITKSGVVQVQTNAVTTSVTPASPTYGQAITFNAICTTGHTCAIEYPVGTQVASSTNSVGYNVANYLAVGSYSFSGNDLTAGTSSILSFSVAQATPTVSCTQNGAATSNGITYTSIAANSIIQCTIGSINNQVSGSLYYNGISVSTGSSMSYNAVYNGQTNNVIANTITAGNYLANSLTFDLKFSPFQLISVAAATGNQYETSTQSFTYTANIAKSFTSANVAFVVNGVTTMWSNALVQPTQQSFAFSYNLPLTTTNGLAYTFNAVLWTTSPLTNQGTVNTISQTLLWNYIPTVSSKPANIILGEFSLNNITISDLQGYARATYAGVLSIGTNHSIAETTRSNYNYFANITSFIPGRFGITNPGPLGTANIPVNAIVQLSFNGNSVYRNVSTSFFSTNQSVGNCNALYPANALQWQFFTVPSLAQYTGNVFMQGYFQIIKGLYSFNAVAGSNAGFPTPGAATSNTYSTCVFPSWAGGPASFNVSGSYTYNAAAYAQAHYFLLNQPVSNVLRNINLYMGNLTGPVLYSIAVQNSTTSSYIAAFVQVMQFIQNTNSSVLINEVQTPTGGTAQAYLSQGVYYKFAVYSLTGQLLKVTSYIQTQACATQPCLMIIYLGNQSVTSYQNTLNGLHYSCTRADNNVTQHLTYINCTYASSSGASYTTTLQILKSALQTPTCTHTVSGASGSLSCSANQTNSTAYHWIFSALVSGSSAPIQQGDFGIQGALYGTVGIWMALIIVVGMAGLFLTKNIIFAMLLSDVAFAFAVVIRLLPVPIWIVGIMQLPVVLIIWLITRQ